MMNTSKEKMIELCQGQLNAYNQRDILKFATFYHPEVRAYLLQNNELLLDGIDEFNVRYKKRFEDNPKLHCELRSRVILEDTILDEEWVTGVTNPSHLVAIYKFKDNLIHSIWFT